MAANVELFTLGHKEKTTGDVTVEVIE